MKPYRYPRRLVMEALEKFASNCDGPRVVAVVQHCEDDALRLDVPRRWYERTVENALTGIRPELDAFPALALSRETRSEDPRWIVYDKVYEWMPRLIDAGMVRCALPLGVEATALQITIGDDGAELAVNRAVEGRFWIYVDGAAKRMEVGLEVEPRDRRTHMTVLHCSLRGEPAALVMFNTNPSIIRTLPPEGLKAFLGRSIGVAGARQRWAMLRDQTEGDDVRTALWESERRGVHPAEAGSFMVDYLEREQGAGSPGRRSTLRLEPLTDALTDTIETPDETDSSCATLDAADRLSALHRKLDPDGRRLLEAMRLSGSDRPSELARYLGTSRSNIEAVLKRVRRKAKEI